MSAAEGGWRTVALESRREQWHTAMLDLLREVNLVQPDELASLVNLITEPLGLSCTIFLVDFEQTTLRTLQPHPDPEEWPVEGNPAGLAYQLGEIHSGAQGAGIVWVPLVDSAERLGVLRLAYRSNGAHDADVQGDNGFGALHDDIRVSEPVVEFANLLGHLVAAKTPYSDALHLVRSKRPMSVASVVVRQLLPPSTFTSGRVVISAGLEPAYRLAGDAYDYAVDGDVAHVAIFDGVGHDLRAALTTTVAVSAVRAARRSGADLAQCAQAADEQLCAEFADSSFVTAVLLQLNLRTGVIEYVNAGHPAPFVVAVGQSAAVELAQGRRTPLGLPAPLDEVGSHQLRNGDRVVLYTDGLIESRDHERSLSAVARLTDIASELAAETPPEAARKINKAMRASHQGPPEDDSTIVIIEWSPTAALHTLPSA